MHLSEHFKDLICAFNDENVRFLIVGAYAMTAHGYPRATGDIDFWIEPTSENARAVIRALEEFKAPFDVTEDELSQVDQVFYMGKPPERIDILTSVSGLSFADAYQQSIVDTFGGIEARMLSLNDLIANKKASGRLKDLADVEALESIKNRPQDDS